MKIFALALAVFATLQAAAWPPAARAEPVSASVPAQHDWPITERLHWVTTRVDTARDDGSINASEFAHVLTELSRIRGEERRLRLKHDGLLSDREQSDLEKDLNDVADTIHWLRNDGVHRPW